MTKPVRISQSVSSGQPNRNGVVERLDCWVSRELLNERGSEDVKPISSATDRRLCYTFSSLTMNTVTLVEVNGVLQLGDPKV